MSEVFTEAEREAFRKAGATGGKKRWKGTTKKQRSDAMSEVIKCRWDKAKKLSTP